MKGPEASLSLTTKLGTESVHSTPLDTTIEREINSASKGSNIRITFIYRPETPRPVEAVLFFYQSRAKMPKAAAPCAHRPTHCAAPGHWGLRRNSIRRLALEQTCPSANSHSILPCGSRELKSRPLPVCRMKADVCILGLLLVHLGPAEACHSCFRRRPEHP